MRDALNKTPRNLVCFLEGRGIARDEIFARIHALAPRDPFLRPERLMSDAKRLPWDSFSLFCDAIAPYFATADTYNAYMQFATRDSAGWTSYLELARLALADFAAPDRNAAAPRSSAIGARLRRLFGRGSSYRTLTAELAKQDLALREGYRRLQRTVEDLDHAKAELETRVETRTRELNAANARLHDRLQALMEKERENHLLTERVLELQMKSQQSQKLDALGTLASGLAHRINNDLHGILLALDSADRKVDGEHPAKANLRTAMTFAARGQETTAQLAAFSRQSRTRSEVLDLREALRPIVKRTRASLPPGLTLVERCTPDFYPFVRADATSLERILSNLFSNAIDVMRETGGQLGLALRAHGAEQVVIEVTDEGPGIPAEILPRIYDPFFTTKAPSDRSGLGLAVVYGLVQALGGEIQARRGTDGRGARFEISLPRERESEAASSEILPAPEVAGGTEKILVVEDGPELRDLLADTLRAFGYEVRTASDGLSALNLLDSESFDLIVTDQIMHGMDGVALARAVRERGHRTFLILCTGNLEADSVHVHELFHAILEKPIDPYQLNAAIRRLLAKE